MVRKVIGLGIEMETQAVIGLSKVVEKAVIGLGMGNMMLVREA